MKRTLLLNSTYEVLQFVTERRAIKLLLKDKVEVISEWMDINHNIYGKIINHPAVLRLKNQVKKKYKPLAFSKKALFRRDQYQCQYCFKPLSPNNITIDHVIPRALGGPTNFLNCVSACYMCNGKKGHKTLTQANMKLIQEPKIPTEYYFYYSESSDQFWHHDWHLFLKK